jgi:ankyrin repeat protein
LGSTPRVTRLEHSVGVTKLLQIVGDTIEEQIATLLDHISHTVFSHEAAAQNSLREKADMQITRNDDEAPLLLAAKHGHKQVVMILLDKGADVNPRGGWYRNALQAAIYKGHRAVMEMLVARGTKSL